MAMIEINRNPSRRQLRVFAGILFPAFFALVGGLVLYHGGGLPAAVGIWAAALLVSLIAWFVPRFARIVYLGWMYAAYPIGWLMSHLLLAAIFFLVFTPLGRTMRLLGYDPLKRKFDRSARSYWVPHDPASDPARYFRQF